jgi:hypothetical protein
MRRREAFALTLMGALLQVGWMLGAHQKVLTPIRTPDPTPIINLKLLTVSALTVECIRFLRILYQHLFSMLHQKMGATINPTFLFSEKTA